MRVLSQSTEFMFWGLFPAMLCLLVVFFGHNMWIGIAGLALLWMTPLVFLREQTDYVRTHGMSVEELKRRIDRAKLIERLKFRFAAAAVILCPLLMIAVMLTTDPPQLRALKAQAPWTLRILGDLIVVLGALLAFASVVHSRRIVEAHKVYEGELLLRGRCGNCTEPTLFEIAEDGTCPSCGKRSFVWRANEHWTEPSKG